MKFSHSGDINSEAEKNASEEQVMGKLKIIPAIANTLPTKNCIIFHEHSAGKINQVPAFDRCVRRALAAAVV